MISPPSAMVAGAIDWIWMPFESDQKSVVSRNFVGNLPGSQGIAVGVSDLLACFHLFLPLEFIEDILLQQTNIYAFQQQRAASYTGPWMPVDKDELLAFLGMNIAMGIVSLPTLKSYWSEDPLMQQPWFSSVMSRRRFLEITRYIHIVDNENAPSRSAPDYDKLWKIRPLICKLKETCLQMYSPHCQLDVDESMIGTKCRLSFLQHMPKKPTKWGIKMFICSDSTNGYMNTFKIYTGKDPSNPISSKGLANDVQELVEPYLDKGYTVYFDNFYTSPQLMHDLLDKRTFSCGTARTNRKHFPKELMIGQTKTRGDMKFAYMDNIVAVRWRDNKDIFAMSTAIGDSKTTVKRRIDGSSKDVPCPQTISDYNQFMGGVDVTDQYLCSYTVGRKTLKWWRKVMWRLIDHAIVKAYVIYRCNVSTSISKPFTHLEFRKKLTHQLTAKYIGNRLGRGRPPTPQRRLIGKHFTHISPHRRRCNVCAYKKCSPRGSKQRGTKTKTWCPKCEKHLYALNSITQE